MNPGMAKRLVPACPICVRWHCLACGKMKTSVFDGRRDLPLRKCSGCHGLFGEYRPITHHDRDLHDAHAAKAAIEGSIDHYDWMKIRDLAALVEFLSRPSKIYQAMLRQSIKSKTGSFEYNEAVNIGNAALLEIEETVRSWVKDHPVETYKGPEAPPMH
jgi:hypothetical protein